MPNTATGIAELTDRFAQGAGQVATCLLNGLNDEQRAVCAAAFAAGAGLQLTTLLHPKLVIELSLVTPTSLIKIATYVPAPAETSQAEQ
jgi:hypothetical protein